ncbi:MAG TPA: GNAT family N-acetyltransferase [Ktedonosporobacter sp.]|nr:GNAT family N-acetyltransferase [Ktedonosporobacter sp.]
MTVIRLRNLMQRALHVSDLKSVTALLVACERVDTGLADSISEDVLRTWRSPDFHLSTDAWVITTTTGHIVGYAQVRRDEQAQLSLLVRVHPDYRGRGIGTLLVWLAEERARHLLSSVCPDLTVTLSATVSCLNQTACHLFEREGYQPVRHFWSLFIEQEEYCDETSEPRKLSMDLVVDAHNLLGTTSLPKRTGMYVARQYAVYQKVLQTGKDLLLEVLEAQPVAV